VLDLAAYPQLADMILSFCDIGTLRVLRGVSRAFRHRLVSLFPRHALIKDDLMIHKADGTAAGAEPLIRFVFMYGRRRYPHFVLSMTLAEDYEEIKWEPNPLRKGTPPSHIRDRPIWATVMPVKQRMARRVGDILHRLQVLDLRLLPDDLEGVFDWHLSSSLIDRWRQRPLVFNPAAQVRVPVEIVRAWSYAGGLDYLSKDNKLAADKLIVFFWQAPGEGASTCADFENQAYHCDWLPASIISNRITLNFDLAADPRLLLDTNSFMWGDVFVRSPAKQRVVVLHNADVRINRARGIICRTLSLIFYFAWNTPGETVLVADGTPCVLPMSGQSLDTGLPDVPELPEDWWDEFIELGADLGGFARARTLEEMVACRGTAPGLVTLRSFAEHRAAEPRLAPLEMDDMYYLTD
jgi:hypothetical protein